MQTNYPPKPEPITFTPEQTPTTNQILLAEQLNLIGGYLNAIRNDIEDRQLKIAQEDWWFRLQMTLFQVFVCIMLLLILYYTLIGGLK